MAGAIGWAGLGGGQPAGGSSAGGRRHGGGGNAGRAAEPGRWPAGGGGEAGRPAADVEAERRRRSRGPPPLPAFLCRAAPRPRPVSLRRTEADRSAARRGTRLAAGLRRAEARGRGPDRATCHRRTSRISSPSRLRCKTLHQLSWPAFPGSSSERGKEEEREGSPGRTRRALLPPGARRSPRSFLSLAPSPAAGVEIAEGVKAGEVTTTPPAGTCGDEEETGDSSDDAWSPGRRCHLDPTLALTYWRPTQAGLERGRTNCNFLVRCLLVLSLDGLFSRGYCKLCFWSQGF